MTTPGPSAAAGFASAPIEFRKLVEQIAQSAHSFSWALASDANALWAWVQAYHALALVSGLADKAFTTHLYDTEEGNCDRLVVAWDDVLALLPDLRAHVAALPPQGEG